MKNTVLTGQRLSRLVLSLACLGIPLQEMHAQYNLTTQHTTLGSVIKTIKKQSSYEFFYDDKLSGLQINKANLQDVPLEKILDEVLKEKSVAYKIEDNIVYLSQKEQATPIASQGTYEMTGKVTDAAGEPLIGVNVSVKGTSDGTITDYDGRYTLKINSSNAEVLFSYIGYQQQVIAAKGQKNLNVILKEDTQLIDEVVVTALGIKREKKMLGYAMQEVKSDELNTTGDAQVTSALQGKVAGLQINSSTTGLGGSAKITIRGNSSLTDNNQPLWIVDGVPFSENTSSSASMYEGVDRGSTSFDINPEDIESISVLKGPNAAALYGSRAGNGVILVTTKKGIRKDGFGVNYSGTCTWTHIADALDTQTLYGQGSNGEYSPKSMYSFGPKLDGEEVEAWNGEMLAYRRYGNKMMDYFNTGFSQNHNVSIGNVTETSHFRTSFGASKSKGMFEDEKLRKFNIDLNAGMKFNKYMSMDAKISLSNTKAWNRPTFGTWGEISQLLLIPNNVRLEDLKDFSTEEKFHNNWTGPTTDYLNPYYVNKQHRNSDERWRAFGYYNLKLNLTEWLTLSSKYAFDYYRTNLFEANLSNGTKAPLLADITEDGMSRGEENYFESNAEFVLIGNNNIGEKIKLGYNLGGNLMYAQYNTFSGRVSNMVYKNQWMFNHAHQLNSASEGGFRRGTNSIFGSLQIAYNEYLSLDLTGRQDWSSTLPTKHNSYFYPSANVGFVVSDFMQSMDVSVPTWLTFAKLRVSAAKVGKDTDPFKTYNVVTGGYMNGIYNPSVSHLLMNPNLKNETAYSYEGGLDMKFFSNRLGFDFTYYHSRTKNQIMVVPAPAPWNDGQMINSGLIVNKGLEAMIYATPIKTKDFTFDLNINLAHNKTTVDELNDVKKHIYFAGDPNFPVNVGAVEGGRLGEIYAKKVFKRDENGNIITNNGVPDATSDEQYRLDNPIGCIQPKLLMSVTPSFNYKGIILSAMFDMKFGGDIVSVSEAVATSHGVSKMTEKRGQLIIPGVKRDGTPNDVPVDAELYYQMIGGRDQAIAENFVYDASFIRLKEISLGYAFPNSILKKTPLTALRISLVGRNLAYLLKHTPGTSPEGGYDTSMFSQAIDFSSLPYSRTFGFSINVGF